MADSNPIHPARELAEYGIAARKSFGQNFVTRVSTFNNAVAALNHDLTTLEIGPGLGALTSVLLEKNINLTVIEIDNTLVKILAQKFTDLPIEHDDFLKIPVEHWEKTGIKQVIGNLPFYITTDILIQIVTEMPFIERAVLGVQWEFAERAAAGSGSSLSLFLNAAGDIRLAGKISRKVFYPSPSVDAGWLVWDRNPKLKNLAAFEVFLRGLFWGRRKNIQNCLRKNPHYSKHEISRNWSVFEIQRNRELLMRRPDSLSFPEARSLFMELTGGEPAQTDNI